MLLVIKNLRASVIGFVLAIIVSGVLLLVIRNKRANK